MVELQMIAEPFWEYNYKFESVYDLLSVYANGRAIKQLYQRIGHPQHTWLDISHMHIMENNNGCDCDYGDGVSQVVDRVHDMASEDAALSM